MNKRNLIDELSCRLHISKRQCEHYLNAHLDILSDELCGGGDIMLQGFGTFSPWSQTCRAGRNPRTGEPCMIHPRTSVKFKPGRILLGTLNGIK